MHAHQLQSKSIHASGFDLLPTTMEAISKCALFVELKGDSELDESAKRQPESVLPGNSGFLAAILEYLKGDENSFFQDGRVGFSYRAAITQEIQGNAQFRSVPIEIRRIRRRAGFRRTLVENPVPSGARYALRLPFPPVNPNVRVRKNSELRILLQMEVIPWPVCALIS
jgi:hypothetical protein